MTCSRRTDFVTRSAGFHPGYRRFQIDIELDVNAKIVQTPMSAKVMPRSFKGGA
jgi:hypothetical protein